MALVLTEDETMLVDAARGLFSRSAPVSALRALRDADDPLRYSPALWSEMAESGFAAPQVPEADGGLGMGYAAAGLIAEQMGHSLVAAPFLSAALAAELLMAGGDDTRGLIADILSGAKVVAAALDEGARHAPGVVETRATADGEAYRLEGKKRQVIDGAGSAALVVSARLDGAVALFLVDTGQSGVKAETRPLIDSRNLADIGLSGAGGRLIARGEAAEKAVARALDVGRALLAAELLGVADEAFDRTVGYLKEREQFGRKIGTFQALQHRAARLYARLDIARGVVLKALRALDEGDAQASIQVSLAKAVMGKLARDVLVEAVQMHGGIGVTDEYDISLFFKRSRSAGELLGDDYFHTERLAVEHLDI